MFAEAEMQKWWERRTDDQRTLLRQSAEKSRLEPATVKLLFETQCPVGPVGSGWVESPDFDWSWPEDVRAFIAAH